MTTDKFVRIVNWSQFQHYKDRNPPWIKLHRELLTSRTWLTASDASRALAIACMVLAAETENKIPLDAEYIQRRAYLNQAPDFSQLVASHFIEIIDGASKVLAECEQDASNLHPNARPETEAETEAEKKKHVRAKNLRTPARLTPPTLEQVTDYCQERGGIVDPQKWLDYYTANGWKVGRNSMKDWKAAVRTWERNGNGTQRGNDESREKVRRAAERHSRQADQRDSGSVSPDLGS